jgi:hypothetical protein
MTDEVAHAGHVDGSQLLNQDSGWLGVHFDLGPKGRWSCAPRGRSDDHYRTGKELIRLKHDTEPSPLLLVSARQT